jgi:hypothetical protein
VALVTGLIACVGGFVVLLAGMLSPEVLPVPAAGHREPVRWAAGRPAVATHTAALTARPPRHRGAFVGPPVAHDRPGSTPLRDRARSGANGADAKGPDAAPSTRGKGAHINSAEWALLIARRVPESPRDLRQELAAMAAAHHAGCWTESDGCFVAAAAPGPAQAGGDGDDRLAQGLFGRDG